MDAIANMLVGVVVVVNVVVLAAVAGCCCCCCCCCCCLFSLLCFSLNAGQDFSLSCNAGVLSGSFGEFELGVTRPEIDSKGKIAIFEDCREECNGSFDVDMFMESVGDCKKLGRVIGRGGETLLSLEEESNAVVAVCFLPFFFSFFYSYFRLLFLFFF